jgi:GntR family carbon starvation induced transcriptional regulator
MSLNSTVEPDENTGSLTSRAYVSLRTDIIEGTLGPGTKLKVEELRKRYGVGASPVREALSLLTSDGLIDRIDQRGFRVADVTNEGFADILKARCWLEELALRESIKHGDSEWEETVVLAFYRLSREPRSIGDSKTFVTNPEWDNLHQAFHHQLLAACGSPILLEFCNRLYDQNARYRNFASSTSYPRRDTRLEHEKIMQATVDRDADLAAERLISHYRKTGDFLTSKPKTE